MRFFVLGCIFSFMTGYTFAQCPLGIGWTPKASNKCMMCGTGTADYATARAACQAAGGDLSSILNRDQEIFAEGCSPAIATSSVWMGLRLRLEGTNEFYGWLDASPETENALPAGVVATPLPTAFADNCFQITAGAIPAWEDPSIGVGGTCNGPNYYVCSRGEVTCPAVIPPEGSSVTHSPTDTPYYPGNVAIYSCSSGYALGGTTDSNRTCQNDGTWSGEEPQCNPVNCGPLTAPANGQLAAEETTYNSVAAYSCNNGYTLVALPPP